MNDQRRDDEPEIIDGEYEVLEEDPRGPVIDAEPIPTENPTPANAEDPGQPSPGPELTPGAMLGNFMGGLLNTPFGRVATIGFGLYQVGKAFNQDKKQKKKRRKKVRRAVRRARRRL